MKLASKVLFALVLIAVGLIAFRAIPVWTVEPAERGKWRSCYSDFDTKSCGSPTSYDEAKWWSETKGGRI